jgi:hypothetical protein
MAVFDTPEDEKMWHSRPCSLVEQARAPAPHGPGVFHGKACGHLFIQSIFFAAKPLSVYIA